MPLYLSHCLFQDVSWQAPPWEVGEIMGEHTRQIEICLQLQFTQKVWHGQDYAAPVPE